MGGKLARSASVRGATPLDYEWDAEGHRVGKRRNGVLEKQWLYRGDLQVVAELNDAGVVQKRFVYAEGVNVPELMIQGGNTYRLVKDHLGSVRAVVNQSNGTVAQRIDYDAWGRVLADSSPGLSPFGFAGGLYDPETGLVRFGARDFVSDSGTWSRKDDDGFAWGTWLYGYGNNDPINLQDFNGRNPAGLFANPMVLAALAAGAAASAATAAIVSQHPELWPKFPDGGPGLEGGTLGGAAAAAASSALNEIQRCKQVKEACIDKCTDEELPTCEYDGMPFHKCMRDCLEDHGCWTYGGG